MDVCITDERGRKRPLNEDLVYELLGNGDQSDLELSDDEGSPDISVPVTPNSIFEPASSQEDDGEESDPEMDIPLAQMRETHVPENTRSQNQDRNLNRGTRQKKRPRIWRRTNFVDKIHDYNRHNLINGEEMTPLQYQGSYFDDEFYETIARCTNLYYMRQTGRVLNTNSQEIRKLFGILLVMGCIPYPRIHMYWRAGTRLDIIANNMSRDRFFQLRNNIHIVESDEAPAGSTSPLWKVQPMLDAVRNACLKIERVPGFYSIDEQMIPFTGRCKLRVLVKNKPRPVGLKNYVITTSDGLMLDFAIYYPNNPTFTDKSLGEGPAVILAFAENVPPNSCIYFDRYFNTIPLLDRLSEMNIHGTGTIMLNRVPDHKKLDLKKDTSMKRGDIIQYTSQDVALVKWKDNKGVLMASNCTGGNQTSTIPRWDKKQKVYVQVTAPAIVLNYNSNMGGVDVLDQMIEYYRTYQKTKKWTVKVLVHFLDLAVTNSWRKYKTDCAIKQKQGKDLLWFRMVLADALIYSVDHQEDAAVYECQPLQPVNRPLQRYKPALAPSFDKRFDNFKHIPIFDDLTRGRKCQNEGCSSTTKGMESEKDDEDEDYEEMHETSQPFAKVPKIPEVSITVMRPTGETLQSRQGIQQLASKDCLVCGRSYRYSHNARRHELTSHSFDRYTNKTTNSKKPSTFSRMPPKLRPNPFNPKARLMPNPISHKMQLLPKPMQHKMPQKVITPPKPIPVKPSKTPQNNLPYPLRIKALKDLQIKKKEPQILKTLLTAKPEVLISEPEIINSAPESPETLISEPEIASFQVETILSEPDDQNQADEVDGEVHNNQNQTYDTVDMESDNEIEIARQKEMLEDEGEGGEHNGDQHMEENLEQDIDENAEDIQNEKYTNEDEGQEDDNQEDDNQEDDNQEGDNEEGDNNESKVEDEVKEGEDENEDRENENDNQNENEDEDLPPMELAPVVEINEELQTNSYNSEANEEDEEMDDTIDPNDTMDSETKVEELDPDKQYVTKAQKDFIAKYRDIIQQINTKRCLCCDKEYPRRKAVIQHLQKNGHKVPKHTCYNCVVTFGHIGALLSHMRSNTCTDLWKIIYNENGITDDMVLEDEPKKPQYKDIFNARSYACKLCPAKFQLKQFIMKHVLDVHEDGQSQVPLACVHCGARFKERVMWKKHIRNGDCTVYIACDLCTDKFVNMQDFNDHALAEHAGNFDQDCQSKCIDGRMTDCPICGKKHSSYLNLVRHLKTIHNEEKPHYCKHCDAKFEQTADLNKHIYTEHSSVALETTEPDMSIVKEEVEEYHYSCTECNAIFETVDAWTDHQVAEHNQVAHYCDQCDKKFLRPSELAEHKNTHLRVKFYPCSICPNSYSTPQKLSEHVQQSHPGAGVVSADSEFYCDICIRSFKSRQAYSNHMRIHAKVPTTNRKPGEPKGFSPQIIGKPIKQFNIAQTPNLVFKSNPNVPNAPYSCDICGKGFMHKKNIWKHKKVLHADLLNDRNDSEENTMHASTEEDEYNIDENGALLSTPQFNSFNFTNFTNNVQQQLTQGEVYTCDICYQRFSFRDSLRKHKRAKHGIKSSALVITPETQTQVPGEGGRSNCTICKISFTDKKSYYRHRKNVHKSSTQMCKICGKPLNSTLELYEHLKAAHARELLGYNANQGSSKSHDTSQEQDIDYDPEEATDPSVDYQARYPCDTCGKQFVGLLALQNHQCINQISNQPQTFDCEICHKSYTSIAALKSHRGWHLRSPDGKAAANNTGLWMPQHKVTSKVSKHEVVDHAQVARTVQTPSTTATKRRLPPEVEVTVVNPNKKLRSDDSVEFEQHNSTGGLEDRYCTICDKEFTKRAAYQRHMDEVHQPNSVFCPVCNKSFTRKSTLLVHMKKHYEGGEGSSSTANQADDDSYACDLCGAQYDNAQALQAHRVRHHGEEESDHDSEDEGSVGVAAPGEFTCAQCGDGVATPRDLIAHRTMHATPTKYFCNICKVYFARALDLSSHTRARHAESEKSAMFPCAMCDRFYMNKKSLQRHIEMAH